MTALAKRRTKARARPVSAADRARARRIFDALRRCYPDARCELSFSNPHELLAAVILSAQCTDTAVNKATPALFAAFPTPQAFAAATPEQIEPYVRSLGFFRQKARSIHASMSRIVSDYGGRVPDTMAELLTLRGVARKTANVVLGNAFGKNEGVVVDTHVIRVAKRLGLTKHKDPARIERDLMALFPRDDWAMLSHLLIFHGRRACKARGALCAAHPVCRRYCSNAMPAPRRAKAEAGRAANRPGARRQAY